jgi:hypothetical protein
MHKETLRTFSEASPWQRPGKVSAASYRRVAADRVVRCHHDEFDYGLTISASARSAKNYLIHDDEGLVHPLWYIPCVLPFGTQQQHVAAET